MTALGYDLWRAERTFLCSCLWRMWGTELHCLCQPQSYESVVSAPFPFFSLLYSLWEKCHWAQTIGPTRKRKLDIFTYIQNVSVSKLCPFFKFMYVFFSSVSSNVSLGNLLKILQLEYKPSITNDLFGGSNCLSLNSTKPLGLVSLEPTLV